MGTQFDPTPSYWHDTRPHEPECQGRKTAAKLQKKPEPECMRGCRYGQPWETFRMEPERRTSNGK